MKRLTTTLHQVVQGAANDDDDARIVVNDRALCATTARWLAASSAALGALGLVSALAAVVLLMARAPLPGLAIAALALVLVERVCALRTRFDAGLFADLAGGAITPQTLDASLHRLKLRAAPGVPRSVAQRVHGARALSVRHAVVAAVQFALVVLQATLVAIGWPA